MFDFIVECIATAFMGGIGVVIIALFVSAVQMAVEKIKDIM